MHGHLLGKENGRHVANSIVGLKALVDLDQESGRRLTEREDKVRQRKF